MSELIRYHGDSKVIKRICELLNTMSGINFEVVETLPTTDISTNTIYLLSKQTTTAQNVYDEYINTDGTSAGWELIGDTEIDLSDYYTKTETDEFLDEKVDKVSGKGLSTNDYTTAEKNKLSGIASGAEVNVQADWNVTNTSSDAFIKNKPAIPAAQVNSDWNASSGVAQILNKPNIPAAQVNSDWNASSGVAQILNKPNIPAAQVNSDWNASSGVAKILNKPAIPVANNSTITIQKNGSDVDNFTTNAASDKSINITMTKTDVGLGNVPNVTTNNQKPTFTQASTRTNLVSGTDTLSTIMGKIMKWFADLKAVAFSGNTSDLTNDSNFVSDASYVHTDNNYTTTEKNKLSGIASGAEVNVQADWSVTSTTSDAFIKNKPTIPAAQVNSDWNASSGVAQILNKPTIPTVNNATLTIQKNGTNVQTFTANASANKTANITVPTTVEELSDAGDYVKTANAVTGVKGNSETNYRKGNVNLTAANIGALALTGGTLSGNLTIRRDSEKTESADPDNPAQLALQTRWTDQTAQTPETKTANSYLRAYPDRNGGNNVVLSVGSNLFIGSGEAPVNHYNAFKEAGSSLTSENAYFTADTSVFIQAAGNTIANRRGFRMDVASSQPRIIPCSEDGIVNNIGMIGHPNYKWANGYFTKLNGNTMPTGTGTIALLSDITDIFESMMNWLGPITISSNSASPTDIAFLLEGTFAYHDALFVCQLDSANSIFAQINIPIQEITNTSHIVKNKRRIFRSGWYQSGTNGGEFDISFYAISASSSSAVTWEANCYGSARMNNAAVSNPEILMYYR